MKTDGVVITQFELGWMKWRLIEAGLVGAQNPYKESRIIMGGLKLKVKRICRKQEGAYWTYITGKELVMNTFNTFNDNEFIFDNGFVTHYQPIIRPEKPIY